MIDTSPKKPALYRYITCNVLTNEIVAEIPFQDVSYSRTLKDAGTFSGTIPILPIEAGVNYLDMYESTMPGKTALYVMRDDVCVWGGIIWSRQYEATERMLNVSASEFTSYLHKRVIWKTWSNEYSGTAVSSGGTTTITLTDGSYFNFVGGESVRVIFNSIDKYMYNDFYTVNSGPSTTVFSVDIPGVPSSTEAVTVYVRADTYDYTRQILDTMSIDYSNIEFPNTEIEPGLTYYVDATSYVRSSNVVTLTTSEAHGVVPGQPIGVANISGITDGEYIVASTPSDTELTFASIGSNTSVSLSATTRNVSSRSLIANVVTITTSSSHGFTFGDIVTVSGVDSVVDGVHAITAVTSNSFTYGLYYTPDIPNVSAGGTAKVSPYITYSSYGGYRNNSDLGFEYSTEGYSGVSVPNQLYRGYELQVLGEILDSYSNVVDGFEYRIDCSYNTETSSFTRTLVFLPLNYPDPPAEGEVSPASRFGADDLIFEYPGSITKLSMQESADTAATRFWVQGDIGDLGEAASQPYSAAAATDLLAAGWPILDEVESRKDLWEEGELATYAEQYLDESRPPISNIEVEVNGSLYPYVGIYKPGDWCSIVIDDPFIQMRLDSDLEPRDNVLIRKINSFSVTVPNTPAYPETVTLELVQESKVDSVGT